MEKWEATETSRNALSELAANSVPAYFQVWKFTTVSVAKAHTYREVPAPPAYYFWHRKTDGIETYMKITSATLDN